MWFVDLLVAGDRGSQGKSVSRKTTAGQRFGEFH